MATRGREFFFLVSKKRLQDQFSLILSTTDPFFATSISTQAKIFNAVLLSFIFFKDVFTFAASQESRRRGRVVRGRRALKGEARKGVTPSSHLRDGCEACEVREAPVTRATAAVRSTTMCRGHASGF